MSVNIGKICIGNGLFLSLALDTAAVTDRITAWENKWKIPFCVSLPFFFRAILICQCSRMVCLLAIAWDNDTVLRFPDGILEGSYTYK